MYRIQCAEVWGGIRDVDTDACSRGLTASLFSSACTGGKGGDIYYLSVCGTDMLTRIAIADVVGHGESVSDVSQWLFDTLKDRMNDPDNHTLLHAMNNAAVEHGLRAMTTASVIGYYSADTHGRFAYAGHIPALLKRADETEWHEVHLPDSPDLANMPLGVLADTAYAQEMIPLNAGDRILLYTDGLIEAPNEALGLFGRSRLLDVLNHAGDVSLQELKSAVLDAVRLHTGGSLDHDDVTVLAVEIH